MSELARHAPERFRIDTETIPVGIDPYLVAHRTLLVEQWRNGEATARDSFIDLLGLYWSSMGHSTLENDMFLAQSATEFPVEAGMSPDETGRVYHEAKALWM